MTQQPDIQAVKFKLVFTCAYEKDRIPPHEPEADQLYKHALSEAPGQVVDMRRIG